jgi:hypothetical protein
MARRGSRTHLPDPDAPQRPCDAPDCLALGEFRAPRARNRLNEYLWFCLPHVREYNSAWDYYKGMSPDEIESNLRQDSGWQRPTWPLGRLGGSSRFDPETLRDPLGMLRGTQFTAKRRPTAAPPASAPPELRAALGVLGLEWPVDQPALRARYKELAKRYHPDINGGDRDAEDRLKDVNRAYSLLRQRIPRPVPAAAAPAAP